MVRATQKWIPIVFMVICFLFIAPTTNAHNACGVGERINLQFPEHDPDTDIPPSDPRFVHKILDGIPESIEIKQIRPNTAKHPFNDKFSLRRGPNGTFIQMIKGIDRDGPSHSYADDVNFLQYIFKCVPTIGGETNYKVLTIRILDVNDNKPQFVDNDDVLTISVNELAPIGLTVVNSISAPDSDTGYNRIVEYSLSKAVDAQFDGSNCFILPSPQYGIITVNQGLDFDYMYRTTNNTKENVLYKMIITATDHGNPSLSNTLTLNIKIIDNDDQGPAFEYPSCIRQNNELVARRCIRPNYTSSVNSDVLPDSSALVLLPQPVDPKNPDTPVEMIMYDMDTLDYPVTCSISHSRPNGYTSYFQATANQVDNSKRYRCTITQTRSISRSLASEIQLFVNAVETSIEQWSDYATVIVTVNPRGKS